MCLNNYKIYTSYIVIALHIKICICQIKVKLVQKNSPSDKFIHPLKICHSTLKLFEVLIYIPSKKAFNITI